MHRFLAHRRREFARPAIILFASLALLAAACGSDEPTASTDTSDPSTTEPTTETTEPSTAEPTEASTTTTEATTTTTEATTTTLVGEPFDGFMDDGDVIGVVGVEADDVLNVRAAPDAGSAIIATLEPTATGIEATGDEWLRPGSIWYEIRVDGSTGWVNSSYVAFIGGTDDFTAGYIDLHGRTTAETMNDLGLIVAENLASVDPPSRITRTVAASVGDLGEVTYDVVGIGDDATAGFRLHVFATEDDSGDSFTLRTIERTVFCSRGLSGESCV